MKKMTTPWYQIKQTKKITGITVNELIHEINETK